MCIKVGPQRGRLVNARIGWKGKVSHRKPERVGEGGSETQRQGSSGPALSCLDQGMPLHWAERGQGRLGNFCITWKKKRTSGVLTPAPSQPTSASPGSDEVIGERKGKWKYLVACGSKAFVLSSLALIPFGDWEFLPGRHLWPWRTHRSGARADPRGEETESVGFGFAQGLEGNCKQELLFR